MRLRELAASVNGVRIAGDGDPEIASVEADSRKVRPGALFFALAGAADDGNRYIMDAVAAGAAAVATATPPSPPPAVPMLLVEQPRRALGEAADALYSHPSRRLALIGVTGTNGKTTTAYLVRHILNRSGVKCGMLGTIQYDLGGDPLPSPLTTPDAASFTRHLAGMVENGCRAAVAETSSHALEQDRTWPHRFACGVFTNLTRDHLDYHGDMDSYAAAKRRLFTRLDAEALAVFNLDDPFVGRLSTGIQARSVGYTLNPSFTPSDSVYRAEVTAADLRGQRFRLRGGGLDREFELPMVGTHNIANCLAAILSAGVAGVGVESAADCCREFGGVPGRLERIETPSGAQVFIDYAHTDDALHSVLSVLRPLTPGQLRVVFGCGGDRDRGKRPLMAKAAEDGADMVVTTSDNPRTEDQDRIFADIRSGLAKPERTVFIRDRAEAVAHALAGAGKGDVVLVAGKGHEDYQIIGVEKRHLDDRELVRDAMAGAGKRT